MYELLILIVGVILGFLIEVIFFGVGVNFVAKKRGAISALIVGEDGNIQAVDTRNSMLIPSCDKKAGKTHESHSGPCKVCFKVDEEGKPLLDDGKPILIDHNGQKIDESRLIHYRLIHYAKVEGSHCVLWYCGNPPGTQQCVCQVWGGH